ncbi:hypothetical protein [Labrys neptuniae]
MTGDPAGGKSVLRQARKTLSPIQRIGWETKSESKQAITPERALLSFSLSDIRPAPLAGLAGRLSGNEKTQ